MRHSLYTSISIADITYKQQKGIAASCIDPMTMKTIFSSIYIIYKDPASELTQKKRYLPLPHQPMNLKHSIVPV